ncbi:MAG: hypothetical protein LBG27_10445 [Spirochaetaceae bacterium]|jgi:hypothetical protein|nr:hypothetical protein [Spirochaetaceae bacterium]
MRSKRKLVQNVWYKVGTEINIGEPLFRLSEAKVLLYRVLGETKGRYGFEMRGLTIENECVSFYIKPEDGFMLPLIMQLLKQTFFLRFNIIAGRRGHVWGERYESEILWGGPPERAEEVDWAAIDKSANTPIPAAIAYTLSWDGPRSDGMTITTSFSAKNASKPAPSARITAQKEVQPAPHIPAQDSRERGLPNTATWGFETASIDCAGVPH